MLQKSCDALYKGQIKIVFSELSYDVSYDSRMAIRITKFGQLICDFCATFRISNRTIRMINCGVICITPKPFVYVLSILPHSPLPSPVPNLNSQPGIEREGGRERDRDMGGSQGAKGGREREKEK